MTATMGVTVVGVKDALKELNKTNPKLRREITRDYKRIVAPAIADMRSAIPGDSPLSGMKKKWTVKSGAQIFPYNQGEWSAGIIAKINTRRPRPQSPGNQVSGAFRIVVRYGAGLAVDMVGRKKDPATVRGGVMASKLTGRFGPASRFMWPAALSAYPQIEDQMIRLVERVMAEVGQKIQKV